MEFETTCCTPSRIESGRFGDKKCVKSSTPLLREREVALKIVPISKGKSFIGTNNAIISVDEEYPLRTSRVQQFWIDSIAVTNARFANFVGETGYQTEAERFGNSFVFFQFLDDKTDDGHAVVGVPWWRMVLGACWHRPAGVNSNITALPDHPVVHISWHDAVAFANWAGGRLPTEAEWEHAARGGLGDVSYPWGDEAPDDTSYFPCNIWQGEFPNHNSSADGFFGTAPARSFQPNGYGLYNMVGNVWEWTVQNFKVRSLKKAVREAHKDKQGFKICKGGSYLCHASYCHRYRIAARTANSPESSTGHTGFRLVYDTPPKKMS